MTVRISILFLENDIGKAGLTPTIKITRDSDHVVVVNDVEVTDEDSGIAGHYLYEFANDTAESYFVRVDSVTLTGNERYAWAIIQAYLGEYDAVIAAIQTDVTFMKDIEGGKWEIDTVNNQMVFYKSDNVTEVARFNLFNSAGVAASENIFKRERV